MENNKIVFVYDSSKKHELLDIGIPVSFEEYKKHVEVTKEVGNNRGFYLFYRKLEGGFARAGMSKPIEILSRQEAEKKLSQEAEKTRLCLEKIVLALYHLSEL